MRADSGGEIWNFVVGFAVGAGISMASEIASQAIEGNGFNIGAIVVAGIGGGVSTAFGPLGGALISGATNAATSWIKGEKGFRNAVKNFAVGACLSGLTGSTTKALTSNSVKGISKGVSKTKGYLKGKPKNYSKKYKPTKYSKRVQRNRHSNREKWRKKRIVAGLNSYYNGRNSIFYTIYKKYGRK